jgi:hypothetical protein
MKYLHQHASTIFFFEQFGYLGIEKSTGFWMFLALALPNELRILPQAGQPLHVSASGLRI